MNREKYIRDRYIADLRTLADLLERNPSLPLPRIKMQPVKAYLAEHYGLSEDELRALNEAAKGALPQPPSYLPDPSARAQYEPPATDRFGYASLADHLAAAIRKVLP